MDKFKQENYYLQCELDEVKNKLLLAKAKKDEVEKANDDNLSKLEKSKEKLKEKENLYYKAILEKNELEKKFEGQIFKVRTFSKKLAKK
jgi:hypothetical protein